MYPINQQIAGRLEANNIICNYQSNPDEEGFTASGSLRLGVSEMTRFGMTAEDFSSRVSVRAGVFVRAFSKIQ